MAHRDTKSPTVTSGALGFPLPSPWDAPPVLYVAKARPSGSQRPGGGGFSQAGRRGMTRARALHTVPWVQPIFRAEVRPSSLAVGRPYGIDVRRAHVLRPRGRRDRERRRGGHAPPTGRSP